FRGTQFLSYDLGQTGAEPIVSAQDAISFYFRTRQPNGLLFYTGHGTDYLNLALRDGGVSLTMGLANGKQEMHIKPSKVRFDDHQWHKVTVHRRIQEPVLIAIELLNGHIYIHLDLGSGASKVRASRRRVDDGDWHDLILRRNGRDAKVSVDGVWNDFRTPGDGTILELDGHMYLGGVGPAYNSVSWPAAIWTATLRQGFVGCLRDLVLSGKAIDIAAFARVQDSELAGRPVGAQRQQLAHDPLLAQSLQSAAASRRGSPRQGRNDSGSPQYHGDPFGSPGWSLPRRGGDSDDLHHAELCGSDAGLGVQWPATPASGYPGALDDLIFSGAGSGCRGDDEDECTPPFESGSGDDLITPVYVPPTKQTTTSQQGNSLSTGGSSSGGVITNGTERACDDEDCVHGSGDYGETTEQFTSTSTARGSESNNEMVTITTTGRSDVTTEQHQGSSSSSSSGSTPSYATTQSSSSSNSGGSAASTPGQVSTTSSVATTSTQRATSSSTSTSSSTTTTTTTTTTTQATPPPEIRSTVTERDTTPYDVYIAGGGMGGSGRNDHDRMQLPDEHHPLPPLPPPIPPQDPPPYGPYGGNTYNTNMNNYRPKGKGGRINSIEEERTAMIIGIVAGILIAVVLVILLVLWLKSNGDRGYKTESEKAAAYGSHNPNAALLGNTSTNGSYHQQRQHHMQGGGGGGGAGQQQHHGQQQMHNGHNGNGNGGGGGGGGMMSSGSGSLGYGSDGRPQMAGLVQPKAKKRDSKDVKEWYV
ncbi:GD20957, partial [Drosophila simulans]